MSSHQHTGFLDVEDGGKAIVPIAELSPRKTARTLRSQKQWALSDLRRSGVALLLCVEAVTAVACAFVLAHPSADRFAWVSLAVLVVASVVYGEVTDRVERVWIWLHADRGAWVGQGSILCFAGALVLPLWAAVTQVLLTYAHIGIRNKRHATAPAHRWVWTATTVLIATFASSVVFEALGGSVSHVGIVDLGAICVAAVLYSGVNLVVLLAGMYFVVRPPSLRSLIPGRAQFSYEGAKLLVGLIGAVLVVDAPLLTPAVLVFAAILHRSTLVSELHAVANTDDKTGLLTYRAWNEQAASSLSRCQDAGRPAALVLLDLDHFKRLNDTHGHAAGDRTLAAVGAILSAEVRLQDHVGRYGGEEFVIFLPGAGEERAVEIAQRLRECIASTTGTAAVTASLGVAAVGPDLNTLDELLMAADAAMYRAKESGRNTVCVA